MAVAGSVFYAILGVVVTELLLRGIQVPLGNLRIALELCVFFVVSVVFLDPLSTLLKAKLDQSPTEPGRARVSSGVLSVAVVLVFIGFNLTTANALAAFHAKGLGILFYLLGPLFIPGVVTLSWIAGSRQPRRAALYGALAGFSTDALVRLVLWSATGSIVANSAQPDAFGTALVAAISGGIQAGFYAGCGGLALDLTRVQQPVRNLTLALFTAIGLWTLGYHLIGGAFGLPFADTMSQLGIFIIRLLDYGGWMLGLALCPNFAAALQREKTSVEAEIEARFLRLVLFVPALITCDLILFVLGLNKILDPTGGVLFGLILGVLSSVAWQLSAITTPVWSARLNILAGLFAVGSAAFFAQTELICKWAQIPLVCL